MFVYFLLHGDHPFHLDLQASIEVVTYLLLHVFAHAFSHQIREHLRLLDFPVVVSCDFLLLAQIVHVFWQLLSLGLPVIQILLRCWMVTGEVCVERRIF